jgi:uracil-DNA glycosylase
LTFFFVLSDLSAVAKQGVLWLNASLTVRAHKAGSHARKGWETFTAEAIRAVLQRKDTQPGVVFMAWGLHAEKTYNKIGIDEVRSYPNPNFLFLSKLTICIEKASSSPVSCVGFFLLNIPLLNNLYRSAHPSPLSAHRGFLGNGHFQKANEWLAKNYGKDAQINWTVLSAK